MENAISTLTYFNTSKKGIEEFSNKVFSELESGLINPLDLLIYIKSIEKSLELIHSKAKEIMLTEADKYSEKQIKYKGAILSKEEFGHKYDYANCGDIKWNELNEKITKLSDQKKERETFLKTIKDPLTIVDESTGETWAINPPIHTSTTGIKVTIK
ncbi:MAG: hypothetical protein ACHQ1D_00070 [Nitrososphaerales archaeon]